MNDDLYFIPILQEACARPDGPADFAAALRRIQLLGKEPRYRHGYRQFLHLLGAAWSDAADPPVLDDVVSAVIGEIVGYPVLEASPAAGVQASPWGQRFVEFDAAIRAAAQRPVPATIFVELDERRCGQVAVGQEAVVDGLMPGSYHLRLDSGLVLWEGPLEAQDLLWHAAPPGQALRAAAETPHAVIPPSRTLRLLHGEVMVELHRGMQAGSMHFHFQERKRSPQ